VSRTPTTSIRGPKILAICGVVVVTLAGIAAWQMLKGKPRAGAYIDVLALDGGFVVGIRDETTSRRAFVELVGLDEGMRWQALVPSYQVPDGAVGVAAAEHAITVRFPRDGHTQLFGFAAQSARKLGSMSLGHDLPAEADGQAGAAVASISGGAQSIEVLEPDGLPARIYAIALSEGRIQWKHDLPRAGIEAVWVTADHVVVAQPGEVSIIDRRDGTGETRPIDPVCVVPGRAGRADEIVAAALCGRRGGTIHTDATLAPLVGGTLDVAAPASAPGSIPMSGELDRIVPVLVTVGDAAKVVAIDLDARAIAWESAPSAALLGAQLVDAGGAVLVRTGDVLVSFDPATGAARAVRVPDTRPLRAHHVAGGLVWLVGPRGLAALDVTSLALRGTWRTGPRALPAGDSLVAIGFKPVESRE
jgi:hypothetical protein